MMKKKIVAMALALCSVGGIGGIGMVEAESNYATTKVYIPDESYKPDLSRGADNFYKSPSLNRKSVKFKNLYGMKIAGHLFTPKDLVAGKKYPAIVVSHPFGAVKEQSADLYAQKMAEQGFITISIDMPFWGESDGSPRNSVNPDLYCENYSAAVDYLGTLDFIDRNRIGAIGICGSGSFALGAAKIDPRIKAVATVSMYDMGSAARGDDLDARKQMLIDAANQRWKEVDGGQTQYVGGTDNELTSETSEIQREFYDYYRSHRGAFGTSWTTTHPTLTGVIKLMNFYPFSDLEMISPRPVLFIAGDKAHSRFFSEDAYARASEPKELYFVKNAGHVDLYDRTELIPWDKLNDFFSRNL